MSTHHTETPSTTTEPVHDVDTCSVCQTYRGYVVHPDIFASLHQQAAHACSPSGIVENDGSVYCSCGVPLDGTEAEVTP